jgi:hypothetical protein
MTHRAPSAPALALCCAALLAAAPAGAQTTTTITTSPTTAATATPTPQALRNFPVNALRGTLTIVDASTAQIDGVAVRLAPGLRIFNRRNALVFAHTLVGQPRRVNYVIEANTGMLLTAWILTEAEIAQSPANSATPTITTTITVK